MLCLSVVAVTRKDKLMQTEEMIAAAMAKLEGAWRRRQRMVMVMNDEGSGVKAKVSRATNCFIAFVGLGFERAQPPICTRAGLAPTSGTNQLT